MRGVVALCMVEVGILLVASACDLATDDAGLGTQHQAIIGGELCDETVSPSAVAIILDAELEWLEHDPPISARRIRTVFCTGTLIAPDVVLAAAHCLYPWLRTGVPGTVNDGRYFVSFTADLSALAGLDLDEAAPALPADAIEASSWVSNPEFTIDLLYDIPPGTGNLRDVGLLFLSEPVTDVSPAVVITAAEASQLVEGAAVTIAGWGQQTTDARDPLVPPAPGTVGEKVCASSVINEVGNHEMQVGIDASTSRKCHGDSGGPTYMTVATEYPLSERVVGITSHTYDSSDCATGAVDTRVDVWLAWLGQAMTDACDQGERVWCEWPGIIPPDYALADENSAGCRVGGGASQGAVPLLVALVLVMLGRVRRKVRA